MRRVSPGTEQARLLQGSTVCCNVENARGPRGGPVQAVNDAACCSLGRRDLVLMGCPRDDAPVRRMTSTNRTPAERLGVWYQPTDHAHRGIGDSAATRATLVASSPSHAATWPPKNIGEGRSVPHAGEQLRLLLKSMARIDRFGGTRGSFFLVFFQCGLPARSLSV